ncbi:hypothetical protein D9M71_791460 [compost metagenome]
MAVVTVRLLQLPLLLDRHWSVPEVVVRSALQHAPAQGSRVVQLVGWLLGGGTLLSQARLSSRPAWAASWA